MEDNIEKIRCRAQAEYSLKQFANQTDFSRLPAEIVSYLSEINPTDTIHSLYEGRRGWPVPERPLGVTVETAEKAKGKLQARDLPHGTKFFYYDFRIRICFDEAGNRIPE